MTAYYTDTLTYGPKRSRRAMRFVIEPTADDTYKISKLESKDSILGRLWQSKSFYSHADTLPEAALTVKVDLDTQMYVNNGRIEHRPIPSGANHISAIEWPSQQDLVEPAAQQPPRPENL